MNPEREAITRGWYYVQEPLDGQLADGSRLINTPTGKTLTRRLHGCTGRIVVIDKSDHALSPATLLRVASACGACLPSDAHLQVILGGPGTQTRHAKGVLTIDGPWVAEQPIHHPVVKCVSKALAKATPSPVAKTETRAKPSRRVLCFESLMNADMPHNDQELSGGVLHMISPLAGTETEVVFARVKMAITGTDRQADGLEQLDEPLAKGPFDLVCITLLEGYYDGVVELIAALRARGCRAHIAVGGVMPSLAPEHVAAHLPDVSFICRGAGECFVLPLVQILGEASIDHPLRMEQIHQLAGLSGLIARVNSEQGPTLVSARSDQVVTVPSLERVDLDLSKLAPRHIEGGIEISTSRGCIHKCTFCSILGREQFQARSAGGIFSLLECYAAHFRELFGPDNIPANAYRVHICDDDFACDRDRTIAFFSHLLATPFRLSSVQVSIADLCKRVDGRLSIQPDDVLLDTITPACFADSGRPIPTEDFVADHKSRGWSSYLQIGVETFCDAELKRLGKGYTVAHIRAIVNALAARGLHMDGYFIQSNSETTALDLIAGLDELTRTKMAHPVFFHIRFPIVPHLVSYFTSANYRRMLRHGREGHQQVFKVLSVDSHPEYSYPLVSHDIPQDPWVAEAVEKGFFTDQDRYAGSFERLRQVWLNRLGTLDDGAEIAQGERLIRRLDDRARRRAFELLREARMVENGRLEWRPGIPDVESAMANTTAIVGPHARWIGPFKRAINETTPRLVVIPTWQCELRCRYCFIPKQDGRVMGLRTLERSIDMLLAADHPSVILQFFGGEALLEWPLVQHGILYGLEHAKHLGKSIGFILSSNGFSIDTDKLAWLSQFPVKLELSLDGDPDTQNRYRRALAKHTDSYGEGIPDKADIIVRSGIDHEVIMVVHPQAVGQMPENFFHIVDLGFERVQINFALGYLWTADQKKVFAKGLHQIGIQLKGRWAKGDTASLINLEGAPVPVRLNGEITVDWDGTIYGGNGFLHETEHKQKFVVGHLDDLRSFDTYWLDSPSNEYLLDWSYPPAITQNNLDVGRIFRSFHQWMHAQSPARPQGN